MRFFLDNCLPPRWATALTALGEVETVPLRQKFPQDITDPDWINALGREGDWTIVSGDTRITRSVHTREAWLSSGLTAFFLSKGWDIDLWDKTIQIVRWWPHILRQTRMVEPGAGFFVPARVGSGTFERVRLTRKPPRPPSPRH